MVFVFGSNTKGVHGAGAALAARREHGAVLGVGQGRTGNAYAIPTKDRQLSTLPLFVIAAHVDRFVQYARAHPALTFNVTRIGCGLAGYTDVQIGPLFAGAPDNCQLPEGWRSMPPAPRQRCYAGIGSRSTPQAILSLMEQIAGRLSDQGWTLRSGGAAGADTAFAAGAATVNGDAQVFVPWPGFGQVQPGQSVDASDLPGYEDAMELAAHHHLAWQRLSEPVRKLMARNVYQVLGPSLEDPSRFVLCWAPDSQFNGEQVVNVAGGTGLAVRLAASKGIQVINLALPQHQARVLSWLGSTEARDQDDPGSA